MMKRILLVDDMAIDREIYSRLYQGAAKCFHGEVGVDQAESIAVAQAMIESSRPDVVVLDVVMPPDGPKEAIAHIRRLSPTWPPIVVLTGAAYLPELRREAIDAGAEDFILKTEFVRSPEAACERIYNAHLRSIRPRNSNDRDGKRA